MPTEQQVNQLNDLFGLQEQNVLVVFAHGKESGPWGSKIQRLAAAATACGAVVISIDYTDIPLPDARVEHLLTYQFPPHHKLVLVGSSMGGYVSIRAAASLHPTGLFLMAPAIGLQGYDVAAPTTEAAMITIVHGWADDVVPVLNVFDFAQRHNVDLHVLDTTHDLQSRLDQIEILFTAMLKKIYLL